MKNAPDLTATLASIVGNAPERSAGTSVVASPAELPRTRIAGQGAAAGIAQPLAGRFVLVTAELGRATIAIGDILKLGLGSVVGLNRTVAEPVDLLVQGVPFARGEVVVIDDRFAIHIKEIVAPAQAK